MKHTQQEEQKLVTNALLAGCKLANHAFADWEGMIEVGRCVAINPEGDIERIDSDDDDACWCGAPFWGVYLHQSIGGVACPRIFERSATRTRLPQLSLYTVTM